MAVLVIAFAQKPFLLPALLIVLIGVTTRFWAAGHVTKAHKLTQDGPYAYTRNPLYLGSFLGALGTFVLIQNWWLLLLFLVGFALFYGATIRSEEIYLRGKFNEDFETYTRNVPAFFPRLTPYKSSGESKYSWQKAFKNHEHISLVCTLVVVALVFVVANLR
ncbi:MAG: methyltransferase family protein [Armatimonadota bacterium]